MVKNPCHVKGYIYIYIYIRYYKEVYKVYIYSATRVDYGAIVVVRSSHDFACLSSLPLHVLKRQVRISAEHLKRFRRALASFEGTSTLHGLGSNYPLS